MKPNSLAYLILWRVWIRLSNHPDWVSRAESLRIVSSLRAEFAVLMTGEEREFVYRAIDHLRVLEVI